MVKRLQNRVAESRFLLPAMALYSLVMWLVGGLLGGQLWLQFACFVAAVYLMAELNTSHALIRIYSRMVSSSFVAMTCMAPFTFTSVNGAVIGVCAAAMFHPLFRCYQNQTAAGWVFYTFLCLGLGSLKFVWLLYYVPVIWLLLTFHISAMSWRTFAASLLGVVAPYWFAAVYFIYLGNFSIAEAHFAALVDYSGLADLSLLTPERTAVALVVIVLALMGTVHFLRNNYKDKIRIRMFYDCFMVVGLATIVFMVLQPRHFDTLMSMLIVSASPLVGHFFALTETRVTNIVFIATTVVVVGLTVMNLWMLS
jgi:hypothetical protein